MSRGESGRIVIEVDPGMKRRLYASLALSGSTLKDWFIKSASVYMNEQDQVPGCDPSLQTVGIAQKANLVAEKPPQFKTKKNSKA